MFTSILRRRRGATAIEYGLIAALIVILAIGALIFTGVSLNNIFGTIGGNLKTANAGSASLVLAKNCSTTTSVTNWSSLRPISSWTTPSGACGTIGGLPSTALNGTNWDSTYGGFISFGYKNAQGVNVQWADSIENNGTAFADGYVYASYPTSFSIFSQQCAAGSTVYLTDTGINAPMTYASGTASIAPNGSYVCTAKNTNGLR